MHIMSTILVGLNYIVLMYMVLVFFSFLLFPWPITTIRQLSTIMMAVGLILIPFFYNSYVLLYSVLTTRECTYCMSCTRLEHCSCVGEERGIGEEIGADAPGGASNSSVSTASSVGSLCCLMNTF